MSYLDFRRKTSTAWHKICSKFNELFPKFWQNFNLLFLQNHLGAEYWITETTSTLGRSNTRTEIHENWEPGAFYYTVVEFTKNHPTIYKIFIFLRKSLLFSKLSETRIETKLYILCKIMWQFWWDFAQKYT